MCKYSNTNMTISIIIINYNTHQLTKECIDSIVEKTKGVDYEIIVVDNASTDGSQEILASDKRIKFIEAGENLGFGKANNLGVKNSQGEYIFFLNSDTYLVNNAIYELWKFSEEHKGEKIGAVGCILTGRDGNRCHSYAKLPTAGRILKSYLVAPFYKSVARSIMAIDSEDESASSFQVGYVTGADIFVKRDVLDECRAFDPDFFMYSEESEMQHRFKKNGYRNLIIKTPKIVHLEGMSQAKKPKPTMRKIIMTQSSLYIYVKKTQSAMVYKLFRMAFFFVRIPFLLLSKYTLNEKKQYLKMLLG